MLRRSAIPNKYSNKFPISWARRGQPWRSFYILFYVRSTFEILRSSFFSVVFPVLISPSDILLGQVAHCLYISTSRLQIVSATTRCQSMRWHPNLGGTIRRLPKFIWECWAIPIYGSINGSKTHENILWYERGR